MMSIGGAFRSLWHTMTSNDRHASHDSPYRTGQHVPLNQSRHAPLTSVATSAIDSRADLSTSYNEDNLQQFPSNGQNGSIYSANGPPSPASPYSPGMRSNAALQRRQSNEPNPFEHVSPGEIQMQSFQEGLPPPPPVNHTWKKIDRWAEEQYQELYDQLSEGATQNDVNELEHELDVSLPMDVRESLQVHDGQERGGRPTGIIFGCMLLDCEEIVQEWKNWKVVNEEYLSVSSRTQPTTYPPKALGGSSIASSSSTTVVPSSHSANPLWRQQLLDRQDSQPPRAIQKAYASPAWIPLARDWGGNNLAVDLAPGPQGRWGQVIIFGRDYDCKYVVARSWAAFLAQVADDLNSGRWFVDEETQELKMREFKTTSVEPAYLDILRWRVDQKYGRKGPRRRPASSSGRASPGLAGATGSPYGSPTDERGRSPQRFPHRNQSTNSTGSSSGIGPGSTSVARPSPLGRVNEEANSGSRNVQSKTSQPEDNLVEFNSPTATGGTLQHDNAPIHSSPLSRAPARILTDATNTPKLGNAAASGPISGLGMEGAMGEMKTVEI